MIRSGSRLLSLGVVFLLAFSLASPASGAAAATRDLPPVDADLDYQLGGAAVAAPHVGIVVRDRRKTPAPGVYNICYVNAFQTQPDERRVWRRHSDLLLRDNGRVVVDEAWGERLLDIRTRAKRRGLMKVVGPWIDGCAADGFDAVEFDNLDSFSRSRKLIKPRHAKRYAERLVRRGHRAGLATAQKNWAEWNGRSVGFDFAIAEECGRWDECGRYVRHFGVRVLVIEYRRQDFKNTCADYGSRFSVELRDRALTPDGVHDWC